MFDGLQGKIKFHIKKLTQENFICYKNSQIVKFFLITLRPVPDPAHMKIIDQAWSMITYSYCLAYKAKIFIITSGSHKNQQIRPSSIIFGKKQCISKLPLF